MEYYSIVTDKKIPKSSGITSTEKTLAKLCDQTFLKLWSYPNPVKKDGKELCDLLAVFENHVFIFFDRGSNALDNYMNEPEVCWNRWKKDVIDKQINTANGAERYIRNNKDIFLDGKTTHPFPLRVDPKRMFVHKIIVAHGAREACFNNSPDNIYGSLGVIYSSKKAIHPKQHFIINLEKENPVHIFDSHNLPIIFNELDTFYDLVEFIEAKNNAIKKYDFIVHCGEEDLLAHYFSNFDEPSKKHFIGTNDSEMNSIWIGEGQWKSFIDHDSYKARKVANQESYLWDKIIQRTCENALTGTLVGNAEVFLGPSAIREMAKEPRFVRRALSSNMIKSINKFPDSSENIFRNVLLMPSFYDNKAYVFLQIRVKNINDYENEYRSRKRALLEIACGAAKNKFKNLQTIIGIAIDAPKYSKRNAEDFVLMNCEHWSRKEQEYYENANKGLDFFETSNMKFRKEKVSDFPC